MSQPDIKFIKDSVTLKRVWYQITSDIIHHVNRWFDGGTFHLSSDHLQSEVLPFLHQNLFIKSSIDFFHPGKVELVEYSDRYDLITYNEFVRYESLQILKGPEVSLFLIFVPLEWIPYQEGRNNTESYYLDALNLVKPEHCSGYTLSSWPQDRVQKFQSKFKKLNSIIFSDLKRLYRDKSFSQILDALFPGGAHTLENILLSFEALRDHRSVVVPSLRWDAGGGAASFYLSWHVWDTSYIINPIVLESAKIGKALNHRFSFLPSWGFVIEVNMYEGSS